MTRTIPVGDGLRVALLGLILLAAGASRSWSQDAAQPDSSQDRTRQLWNSQFREKRPGAPAASQGAAPAPRKAAGAAAPASLNKDADALGDSLVGVTVWRLRKAEQQDDPGIRIVSSTNEQWTPVRVEGDVPLGDAEKVRVGIEAARAGYLYVVDREQYKDGTYGVPYLIFPTLRLHGGENAVRAGLLVEIPSFADNPPYFTMHSSRPDQVAEVLTVIITPEPLKEIPVGRDPVKIDPAELQQWDRQWGAKTERLEARAQAGKPYTRAEKQAGEDRTRLLTHDDPLPQTMYHVEAKPGNPLLLDIPLRIAR
jgi:hypothetical protein